MKTLTLRITLMIVVLTSFFTMPAKAQMVNPFTFYLITNNGNPYVGDQLEVQVTEVLGFNQVLFYFQNYGPIASSITDVYFDDGSLLGISYITNSPGVSFASPATPGNLPGGNNAVPPFQTTDQFSADSNPPVQPNGVNPGENLGITFDLQPGRVYTDVISEMNSGALRIGLHVQAIGAPGGSDSYINNPDSSPYVIPEPSTMILLGSGLVALAGAAKFRRRK